MKVQKTKRKQDGSIGNTTKHKTISKKKQTPSKYLINRMDEAFLRFPHLPEQVFQKLDNISLTNSMVVGASWRNFIDARDYPWKCFQGVIDILTENCTDGMTAFHFACGSGRAAMVENIIKNSLRLNIDLNAKINSGNGKTAFHLVCWDGHSIIAQILMKNSAEFKIDLNAKDNFGRTAFHLACSEGQAKIAKILMKNSNELNIDLNAKSNDGQTAFHVACWNSQTSIIEMMINKSESLKLDLAARDDDGWTGYKLARMVGKSEVVNLIKAKMPNLAF